MHSRYLSIRLIASLLLAHILSASLAANAQQGSKPPKRAASALEILQRTVDAAGGAKALASVHDFTESGQVTFNYDDGVTGPITIRSLGTSRFRMDVDLSNEKKTWTVSNGRGTKTDENGKPVPLTNEQAVNLVNLTYPIAHVAMGLGDTASDVTFVRIEQRDGHSVYRLRENGRLGLVDSTSKDALVVKEVIIDALTFDIVAIEDWAMSGSIGGAQGAPNRAILFGQFTAVKGIRIPFLVQTKLKGQETMSIRLTSVNFNSGLTDSDFK